MTTYLKYKELKCAKNSSFHGEEQNIKALGKKVKRKKIAVIPGLVVAKDTREGEA